jgi:hypothetical protein
MYAVIHKRSIAHTKRLGAMNYYPLFGISEKPDAILSYLFHRFFWRAKPRINNGNNHCQRKKFRSTMKTLLLSFPAQISTEIQVSRPNKFGI